MNPIQDQRANILDRLERGPATGAQLQSECHAPDPTRRIHELRKAGHLIETKPTEDPATLRCATVYELHGPAGGTAEQWRQRVASLCVGNSRLVFAVSAAFAGPLLQPVGVESVGFHFYGDSATGKTTALKVAASVYGGASCLQRWHATDNGSEAIAAQHFHGLTILDELTQADPMTASGRCYEQINRVGSMVLSAGEVAFSRFIGVDAVRMADIPADAGKGLGTFEELHDREGGADFARHLTGQAGTVYGATGRAWLQWLTENADGLKPRIRDAAAKLARQIVPEAAGWQVERVGARFALVGAAGELATAAGLTGWPLGESERAARECFNAWLAARGRGVEA